MRKRIYFPSSIIIGFLLLLFIGVFNSCQQSSAELKHLNDLSTRLFSHNILDYHVTPENATDRSGLMYSDQGAWFAFGLPENASGYQGFSGPFLLTQQNGEWSSACLADFIINGVEWTNSKSDSYASHLEQEFISDKMTLLQQLVFLSGHTAMIQSTVKNTTDEEITINYHWASDSLMVENLRISEQDVHIEIISSDSDAIGHIIFPKGTQLITSDRNFTTSSSTLSLAPGEKFSEDIFISFIFPEYSWEEEMSSISNTNFKDLLNHRIEEKETALNVLLKRRKPLFHDDKYAQLLAKTQLTLQNNWRIPAGEIKHQGLFPSYHYEWFNGFWSWDSWKQAVGLAYYNPDLAMEQIRLMYNFQEENGFIPDVVYRDTTIEAHNYRDTKPPLSAWAVAKVFDESQDTSFLEEMYPKLKKYHHWWYTDRDHDRDGICEYGSTDGSLIAAKWESGMDNAIRFDQSKILKNGAGAYSIDQESVDLNAYLYADKLYLAVISKILDNEDSDVFLLEADRLKNIIQTQFYDKNAGWFYDTDLSGTTFIRGEGSECWITLWAKVATDQQAEAIVKKMMNPQKFLTRVPLQTMSADHEKFDPTNGYWRGPHWLDQSYFGVQGMRNYGYGLEADSITIKILEGAEGVMISGMSLRENYHPISGKGLNAKNFSWTAAHIIMLLLD
jgi:putative isomerase